MDLSQLSTALSPVTQHLPELSWSDKLAYLAWKLKEAGGKDAREVEVKHSFEFGFYIREMSLPAGHVFIGRPHRKGHRIVLVKGKAKLLLPDGFVEYEAPNEIRTPAGFQTAAYMVTDIIVQTWHPNPEGSRDIENLESEIFEPAEAVLQKGEAIHTELRRLLQ